MSPDLARFADLLSVQFWLMGRDVEHPDGNLLCSELGFGQERAPRRSWPSRYLRQGPEGLVVIWRCGLLLRDETRSMLLVRGLAPARITDDALTDAFDLDDVFAAWSRSEPCPQPWLTSACRWLADYEAAIAAAVGVSHRVPSAGTAPALAPPRPCSLEQRWLELAAIPRD